ncbi:MAG TPA: GFA family protein [Ensifer sp.]|jgi:hypothetical protein|uniref:GFA family protein n=1 Tax=Ensifer sp. TaxID=1872086 RepID=UPI002E0E2B7E|nr:GFA family protein [Ensifer sp.]
MLKGSCHCGGANWTLEGDPGRIVVCNCTMCRRHGALWAYDYEGERITLTGKTASYIRADEAEPTLEIRFCPTCAGVLAWRSLEIDDKGRRRMAVNLRHTAPELVADLPVNRFDGFDTFEDLPSDGKCARDLWF